MGDRWTASPSSPCTGRTSSRARSCWSPPSSARRTLARAVAAAAYDRGAKFVDVDYFDPCVKRARIAARRPGHARLRARRGTASACSRTPRSSGARVTLAGVDRAEPARRSRHERSSARTCCRGSRSSTQDRRRALDELVHRPVPAPRVGASSSIPDLAGGRGVRAAVAASSSTCCVSTSPIRTRRGRSAWRARTTRRRGSPSVASTRSSCAARARS